MKLLIYLALIVVCSAQLPTRCDSPKQWVGRRIKVDRFRQYFEYASHSYDEVNMRTRTIEELEVGTERDYYDTIYLHKQEMEYRLNLRTKKCNVTKLTTPFRYIGVPFGATFMTEVEVGAPQIPLEHLTALIFYGTFDDGARYLVQVTTPKCIPINFDVRSNTTTEHFHESYFGVRVGVVDPSVFNPPPECL